MAIVSCDRFTQFLVDQQPVYDKLIIADIRPEDPTWIGHIETGVFPAFSDTHHYYDRFNSVFPNVTKTWVRTEHGSCEDTTGHPCDKTEHCISWGWTRSEYYLEEQSWSTPLLCYDNDMHVTHAKEHFRHIIGDVLKPATSWIMSDFIKKRLVTHAGKKWVASAAMSDSLMTWTTVGDEDMYLDVSVPPTSKLTPQMLQRRVHPLITTGYLGKNPFKDMPPLIEIVLDMETLWELDKSAAVSNIAGQWRFQDWTESGKYWKYAFSGQLGNYAVRVDPFPLRFNYVGRTVAGLYRYQRVLPYVNQAATGGLRSVPNTDYEDALYQISPIWHRRGLQALVSDAAPINPEMPYSSRDFGGKWQFVMDNLGADTNTGCVIENKRRNKGQFIADFKLAIKPQYTEFVEAIFHKREPACVVEIDTCASDPGYPTQDYDSCPDITCGEEQ